MLSEQLMTGDAESVNEEIKITVTNTLTSQ